MIGDERASRALIELAEEYEAKADSAAKTAPCDSSPPAARLERQRINHELQHARFRQPIGSLERSRARVSVSWT